jgi:hypothetical protein
LAGVKDRAGNLDHPREPGPAACAGLTCCPSFLPNTIDRGAQAFRASRPTTWTVHKVAAKQTRLGELKAADKREAIDKAAKEFRQHASKLIAIKRT